MCDYCSWIDKILAHVEDASKPRTKKFSVPVDPVVIVHGGAGKIPRKERDYMLNEVKNAAVSAYSDLLKGCKSLDAVERAISHMESKPCFNCAKGGSVDVNGEVVTDSAIVCGTRFGCVGAVRDVEHPIALARKVLENAKHILLVEKGAQSFALEMGIPILPPSSLNLEINSWMMDDYLKEEDNGYLIEGDLNSECVPGCVVESAKEGTYVCDEKYSEFEESQTVEPLFLQAGAVGAVAFDRKKCLTSGVSTAGEPRKPIGSISAIGTVPGCGVYANKNGCISLSGEDKSVYRHAPARKILRRLLDGQSLRTAVDAELDNFEKETGESRIGVVALDDTGEPCVSFRSTHFPWALCTKGTVYFGCSRNEKFSEDIKILERPLDCMCGVNVSKESIVSCDGLKK